MLFSSRLNTASVDLLMVARTGRMIKPAVEDYETATRGHGKEGGVEMERGDDDDERMR